MFFHFKKDRSNKVDNDDYAYNYYNSYYGGGGEILDNLDESQTFPLSVTSKNNRTETIEKVSSDKSAALTSENQIITFDNGINNEEIVATDVNDVIVHFDRSTSEDKNLILYSTTTEVIAVVDNIEIKRISFADCIKIQFLKLGGLGNNYHSFLLTKSTPTDCRIYQINTDDNSAILYTPNYLPEADSSGNVIDAETDGRFNAILLKEDLSSSTTLDLINLSNFDTKTYVINPPKGSDPYKKLQLLKSESPNSSQKRSYILLYDCINNTYTGGSYVSLLEFSNLPYGNPFTGRLINVIDTGGENINEPIRYFGGTLGRIPRFLFSENVPYENNSDFIAYSADILDFVYNVFSQENQIPLNFDTSYGNSNFNLGVYDTIPNDSYFQINIRSTGENYAFFQAVSNSTSLAQHIYLKIR